MILKIQKIDKRNQILGLVLLAYIRIPILSSNLQYAGSMQDIQRLADIRRLGVGSQHPTNPGRTGTMGARNQDWTIGDPTHLTRSNPLILVLAPIWS